MPYTSNITQEPLYNTFIAWAVLAILLFVASVVLIALRLTLFKDGGNKAFQISALVFICLIIVYLIVSGGYWGALASNNAIALF